MVKAVDGEHAAGAAPPPALAVRLLVVDDHEVVRQGLVSLLDRKEGFQVVAQAGSAAEAIEAAHRFQPDLVVMQVLEHVRHLASGEADDITRTLTRQEQKILLLIAEGKTNKEIASEIFLSDKTVKNYVSSILTKLSLHHRAQAAAFVARHRLPGT